MHTPSTDRKVRQRLAVLVAECAAGRSRSNRAKALRQRVRRDADRVASPALRHAARTA